MAREFAKKFYKSRAWKECRASFIATRISIDGGMCQCGCGQLGYIVDHITELTPENINDPRISLSFDNFQYLALVCHNKKTFKKDSDERFYFDEQGFTRPMPPIHQE